MKKVLLILAIILLTLLQVFAQSQAPVTWGNQFVLKDGGMDLGALEVYAKGDTVILIAGTGDTPQCFTVVCVSSDNGVTWSPWHVFIIPHSEFAWASAAITEHYILCSSQIEDLSAGFYRTTDLGESWITPSVDMGYLNVLTVRDDTVFCITYDGVTWTADGGITFSPSRRPDPLEETPWDAGSTSTSTFHYVGIFENIGGLQHTFYSHAPLLSGTFEPLRDINPNIPWTYQLTMEFGPDGTGLILSSCNLTPPGPRPTAIIMNVTRDDGETWSLPDTLTSYESSYGDVWCKRFNHQWVIIYGDTIGGGGRYYHFSANNARNWYPKQRFNSDTLGHSGGMKEIDFRANRIRAYSCWEGWNGVEGSFYTEIEGIVNPDSIRPLLITEIVPDDTVETNDTVIFRVSAHDNDTLAYVKVFIRSVAGQLDSIELARTDTTYYIGNWQVPQEGFYFYQIKTEDFWENTRSYPDTGWAYFVTEGWIDAADPFIPHPSSFNLSCYPNPFNSSTTISFSLPQASDVKVNVYDILGRDKACLIHSPLSAGEHHVIFEGSKLSSGIFFVRIDTKHQTLTRKIIILK